MRSEDVMTSALSIRLSGTQFQKWLKAKTEFSSLSSYIRYLLGFETNLVEGGKRLPLDNKGIVIVIRVSDAEKQEVVNRANQMNLSISSYLKLILENKSKEGE